jgi:hypothetical protein
MRRRTTTINDDATGHGFGGDNGTGIGTAVGHGFGCGHDNGDGLA